MNNKFYVEVAIEAGFTLARDSGHARCKPGHILAAMLEDPNSLATRMLEKEHAAGHGDLSKFHAGIHQLFKVPLTVALDASDSKQKRKNKRKQKGDDIEAMYSHSFDFEPTIEEVHEFDKRWTEIAGIIGIKSSEKQTSQKKPNPSKEQIARALKGMDSIVHPRKPQREILPVDVEPKDSQAKAKIDEEAEAKAARAEQVKADAEEKKKKKKKTSVRADAQEKEKKKKNISKSAHDDVEEEEKKKKEPCVKEDVVDKLGGPFACVDDLLLALFKDEKITQLLESNSFSLQTLEQKLRPPPITFSYMITELLSGWFS